MQIEKAIKLNLNKLIRDYKNHDECIMDFFDYKPFPESYKQRAEDLKEREFPRHELADVLMEANGKWGAPQATLAHIEQLRTKEATVVIGGQQAGLLTGPFYTVNKIISLIQMANIQEKELGTPVIPVFWIAGEDHDFDEINHVYIPKDNKMDKHKLSVDTNKQSISAIENDLVKSKKWVDDVFAALPETERTKKMYEAALDILQKSDTYVDFMAMLLFLIFKDEGVILIDSADPAIRRLESDYFDKIIRNRDAIATSVVSAKMKLAQLGYNAQLDPELEDGNLFLENDGERVLLQINELEQWTGKQNEVTLITDELLRIANENPERLSNNVVTRPIMQEFLFPTLAFIGGNGEIAYWSALKGAFHAVGLKVPPVVPRLSFTFVDSLTAKKLLRANLEAEKVIQAGTGGARMNWLKNQAGPPLDLMKEQLKNTISDAHAPLREAAFAIRDDLGALAEQNMKKIEREVEFLHDKMMRAIELRYATGLADFDSLQINLQPFGGLQERIWNPIFLVNSQGASFIRDLASKELSFKEDHYIINI